MAKSYRNIKIEEETFKRLKKIKPLIELEEKISFDNISNLIDYLISYKNKKPFNIEPFKL